MDDQGVSRMMSGAELVMLERNRRINEEGWTPEHDDEHIDGSIARAAVAYALASQKPRHVAIAYWPWEESGFKPTDWRSGDLTNVDERVRNLVKAGALIAAEIDRLQRATTDTGNSADSVAS